MSKVDKICNGCKTAKKYFNFFHPFSGEFVHTVEIIIERSKHSCFGTKLPRVGMGVHRSQQTEGCRCFPAFCLVCPLLLFCSVFETKLPSVVMGVHRSQWTEARWCFSALSLVWPLLLLFDEFVQLGLPEQCRLWWQIWPEEKDPVQTYSVNKRQCNHG